MKKTMLVIVAALALAFTVPTKAQSTNTFVITLPTTNTVIVPAIPAVTASTVTVQSVNFNFAVKRADISVLINGVPKHYTITGADFTTFVTGFQAQYGTPFATYLASHTPQ